MLPSQPCGACQPASPPDYTRPAIDAITQAASTGHDLAGRPADVLASAAAQPGSSTALTARQPGSREPSLAGQLVTATVGYHDEHQPGYAGHSPSAQTTN